jgi:hypothetical protein
MSGTRNKISTTVSVLYRTQEPYDSSIDMSALDYEARPKEATDVLPACEPSRGSLSDILVYVVDDEPQIAEIVASVLEMIGIKH